MKWFIVASLLVAAVTARPQGNPSCVENDDTCTQNQVFTYVQSLQKCACVDLKDARQLTAAAFEKPAFNPNPHKPAKPDEAAGQVKPAEVEDQTADKRQAPPSVHGDPAPPTHNEEQTDVQESIKPQAKPLPGGVHSSQVVEKQSEVQVEEVQQIQEGEKRPAVVGELTPQDDGGVEVSKPLENERKKRQAPPVAHGDPSPAFQGEQGTQPELVDNEEPQQVQGVKPLPGGFHQNTDQEQKKRQAEGEDEFQTGHQRPVGTGQQRPAVIGQNRPSPLPQFETVPEENVPEETNERKKRQDGDSNQGPSESEEVADPTWGKKVVPPTPENKNKRQISQDVAEPIESVDAVPLPVEEDDNTNQSGVQPGSINDQKKRQTVAAAAHQGERQVYPAVPAVCVDDVHDNKKRQTEEAPAPTGENTVSQDADQPETFPAEVNTWKEPVPVHADEVVSFGGIDQIKDRQDEFDFNQEEEASNDENQGEALVPAVDEFPSGVDTSFASQGLDGQNKRNVVVVDGVDHQGVQPYQTDAIPNQDVQQQHYVPKYQNVGINNNVEPNRNVVQYQSLQPQEGFADQS